MALIAISINAKTLLLGESMQKSKATNAVIQSLPPILNYDIDSDSDAITFSLSIPTVDVENDAQIYTDAYHWHVSGFYPETCAGRAALPQRSIMFVLPLNATNIVLKENYAKWQKIQGYKPTPARPPLPDSVEQEYGKNNVPPISVFTSLESVPVAVISHVGKEGGQQYACVNISPFKYAGEDVEACYDCSFTLTYDLAEDSSIGVSESDVDSSPVGFVDYGNISDIGSFYRTLAPANYLIATTPKFENYLSEFVRWKKTLGHNVKIIS